MKFYCYKTSDDWRQREEKEKNTIEIKTLKALLDFVVKSENEAVLTPFTQAKTGKLGWKLEIYDDYKE